MWHKIHSNTTGRYGDIGEFEERQIKFPCWCNNYMGSLQDYLMCLESMILYLEMYCYHKVVGFKRIYDDTELR